MESKSIGHKILYFPLTKIFIGFIVCIGTITIGQIGAEKLLDLTSIEIDFKNLIVGIIVALLAIASYTILFKYYEKRAIFELSNIGIVNNLLIGTLLGAGLQSLTILVIYLTGYFSVAAINGFLFLIPSLTMAFTSAITEEILFRGIVFRILEEKWGSYLALSISAILFGALHLANPNASVISGLGIAIQAGLLLGAAYMYSKSLWFPIAIHFAWNFSQSGIYGASTSGFAIEKSLLTTKIDGPELITGGLFGPEGSIQATVFCLIATIILMMLNYKQNKIKGLIKIRSG